MSHGSGDEENYWPGYVDALTSMVQVLAFVMMMLAMAVFVLSQNVSKVAVQAVAQALDVKTPAGATVAELTKAVVEAAQKAVADKASPATTSSSASQPASQSSDAASTSDSAKPAASDASADKKAAKATDAGTQDASSGATPATPASPAKPTTEGQKPDAKQSSAGETAAVTSLPVSTARPQGAGLTPATGRSLAIRFPPHGSTISPEDKSKLDAFLTDTKSAKADEPVVVQAYAATTSIALSEARHNAFYHAMAVRTELVTRKVAADRIKVRVLDSEDKGHEALVEIIVQ